MYVSVFMGPFARRSRDDPATIDYCLKQAEDAATAGFSMVTFGEQHSIITHTLDDGPIRFDGQWVRGGMHGRLMPISCRAPHPALAIGTNTDATVRQTGLDGNYLFSGAVPARGRDRQVQAAWRCARRERRVGRSQG